eukprot:14788.XXX_659779_650794_1 [CDS] Oithona nana genome sequencing.
MQPTEKSTEFWLCFGLILVLGGWTRFKEVDQPAWVCWDETHFGKMGSWYINRTFFFDVHPPLGKMIIGGVGYLTGYNGTFAFEKPGDLYHDHNYLGMRIACTFLGACLIPFSFLTVWEFTHSINAAFFAGILIVFDIGMLTLNQYILLDPILLFFISGATYAMSKFRNLSNQEFTFKWYLWLSLMGAFIGCAFSVKFVGLFVILLIGINTIAQLWDIMGDLSKPFTHTIKHFIARAFCLIALPIVLYITFFYIHLSVLYKSGNGDGHFSSLFQTALEGNQLHNASMPRNLAFGAAITLKNARVGGGYLHSHYHLYPEGVGAKQQQVTSYAHKDENNKFLLKRWNEDPPLPYTKEWNENEIEFVKHGDLVRLEHLITRRNIHSHQQPAPMSKKQFQITGYGENGTGDANDVWRVEIVGGKDGDVVQTVTTKVKFHHYFMKCVISCSGKQLPKWGYEQQEIACNPTTRDPNAQWNVEDNFYPRLPNVSFQNFAPGFVSRFLESHRVMLQGNAGLKPKEGEYTSRPWEWPINLRGQFFSGNDKRIYLLGNPIIWWGNLGFLALFLCLYGAVSVREQRGGAKMSPKMQTTLETCLWLFLGWALHYIPFWAMGRVLYFHHYFPAQLYASMITAVVLDFLIQVSFERIFGPNVNSVWQHSVIAVITSFICWSFIHFSPLAYGMEATPASLPNSTVHHLKWLDSWEF